MPFKVVQTIEDGMMVLSVVPSNWEEKNILYGPNRRNKLRSLLVQEFSMPDKKSWIKLPCILKRDDLPSFEIAETEVDMMEGQSDTEAKVSLRKSTRPMKKNTLEYCQTSLLDLNDYVPSSFQAEAINIPKETCQKNDKEMIILENQVLDTEPNEIFQASEASGFSNHLYDFDGHQELVKELDLEPVTQLFTMPESNFETLRENQKIIIAQQIKLQNSIDALASLLSRQQVYSTQENENAENLTENSLSP